MKPLIPALWRVVEQARKHADADSDLAQALSELKETELENDKVRAQTLVSRGKDCVVCGRRFVPSLGRTVFCSIGCTIEDADAHEAFACADKEEGEKW